MENKHKIISVILFFVGQGCIYASMFTEQIDDYLIALFLVSLAALFYFMIAKNKDEKTRAWAWSGLAAVIVILMAVYFTIDINKRRQKDIEEHEMRDSLEKKK